MLIQSVVKSPTPENHCPSFRSLNETCKWKKEILFMLLMFNVKVQFFQSCEERVVIFSCTPWSSQWHDF